MSIIFVPKEVTPDETRVAATPETVKQLVKRGFRVLVQHDAGKGSFHSDNDYIDAGAEICREVEEGYKTADVLLKFHAPQEHPDFGKHEVSMLKKGALVISFLWPLQEHEDVKRLQSHNVTSFAMDQIPRISRAQDMDALSSQSNIAGYKAALMAAEALPKLLPLMMTAAGTIKPAKIVIMGAGVAGLQAIATAKRLGAVVEVSDIRPAVKEQVQSLGAKFIEVESDEALEDEGGYAKEVSKDFLQKQQEVVRQHVVAADAVITTALVPGKRAPVLITKDMVEEMKPGSVIVDLAAEQGGNCEVTTLNRQIVHNGVMVIGHAQLAAKLPKDASEMYARNILTVLKHLFDKEANLTLDFEDEITAGSIVTHDGEIVSARVREAMELPELKKEEAPSEDESSTDETDGKASEDASKKS
ncbi:MAG TPA: Re/Si-specific NAD(P)(+) transhydrogenase subunit alpha [Myxococcales bacterium]|nr:NAD(P)(+) transhydrogenase (Re/Si-specific) subunit alpha [Deltaproteobacteria bacterium]MBU48547.1 NAD(P)(+) transhydrogenase (Re/Si-specific) subunit alpha [Deltaproteobacteria bacterium]HAA53860.1 Re/Si-specific NAD(P)(+) transhydrogenase subunit alpha [Myxococcales bacterium]|tara:strand:- start:12650 stop:13897 length:1248 start_codon:yes stop_codon:yes gene_type:complete